MDWKEIGVIIAVLTGVAALFRTVYLTTYQYTLLQTGLAALQPLLPLTQAHEMWMRAIEVKVNTMWDFQLRRGEAESLLRGLALRQSPLIVTSEARAWVADIADGLRSFYRTEWHRLPERDVVIEIERRYGQILLEQVCIPHQIWQGACLIIALAVAKEGQESV